MSLDITWHNVTRSAAVDGAIEKHFSKLQQFSGDITSARVTVNLGNHTRINHPQYSVTLTLSVPNHSIHVEKRTDSSDQDIYHVIHHVFDAGRRQLQDYVRKRQGKVKQHKKPVAKPAED